MSAGPARPASGAAQANLLSALGNNILLFCGLLIAGTFTVIASDRFDTANLALLIATAGVFALSFLAGVFTLVALMNAHNLARRAERYDEGIDKDLRRVESARKAAVNLSHLAFYCTIGAAVSSAAVVALYALDALGNLSSSKSAVTIFTEGDQKGLSFSGSGTYALKIIRDGKGCEAIITLGKSELALRPVCDDANDVK